MEAYTGLAALYDRLTDDFDYPGWCCFYLDIAAKAGYKGGSALECGCGTGKMSAELAKRGVTLIAGDISEDMLTVARSKPENENVFFIKQDMRSIALPEPMDMVICACDGVNYLTDDSGALAFFTGAYGALREGGVLAFDISSEHKLRDVISNGFFGEARDDGAYLWQGRFENGLLCVDLTLFAEDRGGLYRRYDETHVQRAWSVGEIRELLTEARFEDVRVYGDMDQYTYTPEALRAHFTAVKGIK